MDLVRSDTIQFILMVLVNQVFCQFSCSLRPNGVCKSCDCIPDCFDLSDEINCMNMDSTLLTQDKFFPPPPIPPFPLCPDKISPTSPTKISTQTPRHTSPTDKQTSDATKQTPVATKQTKIPTESTQTFTKHNEHKTWTQYMSSTTDTTLKLLTVPPARETTFKFTTAPPTESSAITASPQTKCQRIARGDEFCRRRYRGYYGHPLDCERYIMCEWGEYHECQCPPLTRWDMRIMACIWKYMAPCLSRASETTTQSPANGITYLIGLFGKSKVVSMSKRQSLVKI